MTAVAPVHGMWCAMLTLDATGGVDHGMLVRALLAPDVTAADEQRVVTFIEIAFRLPFLAAFKAVLAEQTGNAAWRAVRPPLLPLSANARRGLLAAMYDAGLMTADGIIGREQQC